MCLILRFLCVDVPCVFFISLFENKQADALFWGCAMVNRPWNLILCYFKEGGTIRRDYNLHIDVIFCVINWLFNHLNPPVHHNDEVSRL